MTARTGNLRSDNKGYPNFIMAAPVSVRAFNDDAERPDWSIRFAATETSKLFLQSSDSFDVHSEHEALTEHPGKDVNGSKNQGTPPTVRLFSIATMANSLGAQGGRRLTTMALECTQSRAAAGTRSVC